MHFIKSIVALLGYIHQTFSACIEVPDTVDAVIHQDQLPMTAAQSIKPGVVSQWAPQWKPPTVNYNVTFGQISKYKGLEQSTVLLTFDFPSDSKGKQCEFSLYLERWAQVCPQGSAPPNEKCSGTFALYSSQAPATPGSTSPKRGDWIGVLQAETANLATWVQPSSSPKKINCPVGKAGFELVPQGDNDYIYFPLSLGAKSILAFSY